MGQAIDYDRLAREHGGTAVPPPPAPARGRGAIPDSSRPPVDYGALARELGGAADRPADFRSTNLTDASGAAVVEPNTLGTVVRHLWAGVNPVQIGQMLPWPKAVGGSGTDNPINPGRMAADMYAVKQQAQAAVAKGDYVTALAKYIESVIPVLGPWMSHQGDQLQAGRYAAAAGDALALAANVAAPKGVGAAMEARYPLAGRAARPRPAAGQQPIVSFAAQHDIPLDAATVSDNLAVKGVQALTDRSLGGSLVATPARARQAEAMTRTGEALAAETHPALVTPEQGGLRVRGALAGEGRAQAATADTAYDLIRTREAEPGSQVTMPGKPTPVQALPDNTRGQLRRMVHELDAAPFTPRLMQPGKYGSSLEHVEGTGGAGAAVFDDIVQRAGSHATRATVQSHLENYLGGGPETPIVKAALEVAGERNAARGGYTVSKPEMGANVMDVPTRLEGRVTGETMGFPVNVKDVKPAIRAVVDQMKRQLPITQQQASPGLKALENILDGPDYGSLSQIDRDLGAIKQLARQGSPLAKLAVTQLEAAVSEAARYGGPEIVEALKAGRTATIAKYRVEAVLDALHLEPVRVVKALTAPKDSAIVQLRGVLREVPTQAPLLARAYLEDLFASPQKVAEWRKLGPETRRLLFPEPGQVAALEAFFALTDRISKTNVNPSGSGYVAALTAQGMQLLYDPLIGGGVQIGAAALARLLRSPAAIRALTQGVILPRTAPAAVRTAVTLRLVQAARDAGVPLSLPQAADQDAGGPPR